MHLHHDLLLDYIDSAYDKIQGFLSNKRAKVLKALDERMAIIKDELKKEADKKKEN